MEVAAVVQARMSSARLPGKVLRPLAGRPALEYLLERLARARTIERVIVATSTDPSDDPIAAFCAERGVPCVRGPHDDVAARFAEVAEAEGLDAFVRVTGDSPLLDQRLVDHAVEEFASGSFDLVTNVFPRTFPHGQSVEVVSVAAFATALEAIRSDEREHVTLVFYRQPERFRIHNFRATAAANGVTLALDTEEDAARLDALLTAMDRPHWEYAYDELVGLAEAAE